MNCAASELFGQLDRAQGFERNALWLLFRNKSTQTMKNGWEGTARSFTGAFRAAYCEHQGDPGFDSLLEELLHSSAVFQSWWCAQNVGSIEEPRPIAIDRPRLGHLEFIGRGLPASTRGDVYCFFFVPERETARSDGYARLLAACSSRD
jgi:hypothetical protein